MVFLDSKGKQSRTADAGRMRKWLEALKPTTVPATVTASAAAPGIMPVSMPVGANGVVTQ